MLRDTDAERDPSRGIVKKGHGTTLHSLVKINTKFGDRISAVLQDSVADGVINHANTCLLLILLLRSKPMCKGHILTHFKKQILK